MTGPDVPPTTALLVIAKAPRPGRVKTRCCPPCTPEQAADLAAAALRDTLDAVLATPAARHVLVLDGPAGDWLDPQLEVVPQRGDGLDERLAAAFDDVGGPALLVGMDTPQITPPQLADALARLAAPDCDAVLGHALDGGWWAIGLPAPDAEAFLGVPMSTATTGVLQQARLVERGLRVGLLDRLHDVDTFADARVVAAAAPSGRFARTVARIDAGLAMQGTGR